MRKVKKFDEQEKEVLDLDIQEGYQQMVKGLTTIDMETDDPNISQIVREVDKKLKELETYIDKNYTWDF